MNPLTTAMIWSLGLFTHQQVMYRRLKALKDAGEIIVTGYVGNVSGNGRTANVYATQRFNQITLDSHELPLSRLILKWGIPWLRGKFVDQKLLPDATAQGADRLHLEFDSGFIDLGRVLGHLRRFESVEEPVLFITHSANRLNRILDQATALVGRLMGCTYEHAMCDPENVTLIHCDRTKIALKDLLEIVGVTQQGRSTEPPAVA